MIIYLYLKTHNVTGLKYLGKTISNDPHSYQGSGKFWQRHIKKHGYDVSTQILLETNNKDEIREAGIYYSKLWDVVKSNDFANLIPESGDGGAMPWTSTSRQKVSNSLKGYKHTAATKEKFAVAQKKQAQHLSNKLKEYLQVPENYKKRCEQLAANWDIPGHRERISNLISALKWCNDGIRNYRKDIIPSGMIPGRLSKNKNVQ